MNWLPMPERFWAKVDRSGGPLACWPWTASFAGGGYGHGWFFGRFLPAHRAAYMLTKGEIPLGYDIDHLCRNRACCNPDHLEAVTRRENLLRGDTVAAQRARVTHCPQGHEYTSGNTYRSPRNQRVCRTCHNKMTVIATRKRRALCQRSQDIERGAK